MKQKIIILSLVFLCPLIFPKFFVSQLEKPLIVSQNPKNASAIIIHGGSTTKDNKLPLLAQQRLNQGLLLWRKNLAEKIIVSGGKTHFNNVEAEIMAKELQTRGVEQNNILIEDRSNSTKENVSNSLELIKNNNISSILVVTSPYHSLRTALVWKKSWPKGDITIVPAEKKLSQSGVNQYQALFAVIREYMAIIWYKTNNWI